MKDSSIFGILSSTCQHSGPGQEHTNWQCQPSISFLFDDYFETVRAVEDKEPPVWSELITFQYFKSAYDDEYYVPNLDDGWLYPSDLEDRRYQESQRHPKIPVQEK